MLPNYRLNYKDPYGTTGAILRETVHAGTDYYFNSPLISHLGDRQALYDPRKPQPIFKKHIGKYYGAAQDSKKSASIGQTWLFQVDKHPLHSPFCRSKG